MMKIESNQVLWNRYRTMRCANRRVGIAVDPSRMGFDKDTLFSYQPPIDKALEQMDALEAGQIANPDENRMVGHYWLRAPELAPDKEIANSITDTIAKIKDFAYRIHEKQITPPQTRRFSEMLVIGLGGSALGPQLVHDALGQRNDKMNVYYLDNTDPDGISRVLDRIGGRLRSTLVVVISKSGGTPGTRNGMEETRAAFKKIGFELSGNAVAVTGKGSRLEQLAVKEKWLDVFPMWDWVGGRTSVTSAVGLLPMALQGIDIDAFLAGAKVMDEWTRTSRTISKNPAAILAACWFEATGGKGERDMVILPYKDRLLLLSRYLQQLVMESLGKRKNRNGEEVHQGISVYGNKGSTDQHAFVQQLRDGVNNFFVNFIVVEKDVRRPVGNRPIEVDPQDTPYASSGDFLQGFWLGTRQALYENGRPSLTISLSKLDTRALGSLIALYERAVGYYGSMININAYNQPGVEAGKKAAASVLDLQSKAVDFLKANAPESFPLEKLVEKLDAQEQIEALYHVLEHLATNKRYVKSSRTGYTYLN